MDEAGVTASELEFIDGPVFSSLILLMANSELNVEIVHRTVKSVSWLGSKSQPSREKQAKAVH